MKNRYGVDLDETLLNAAAQGIDLSEITLFYTGLTDDEKKELARKNLLVETTNARTMAKFHPEGLALFPEKVSEVYYLGA